MEYMANIVSVFGGQGFKGMDNPAAIPALDYGSMIDSGMKGAGAGMGYAQGEQEMRLGQSKAEEDSILNKAKTEYYNKNKKRSIFDFGEPME